MPEKFLSKTDNLFLVALCETTNLKDDDKTFDEIGKLILDELKQLEKDGIKVDGITITGSLARFISDNLGANGVHGFNSYFCRLCEVSKKESMTLVKERPEIMRTKESYERCVEAAENFTKCNEEIDLKVTKGV